MELDINEIIRKYNTTPIFVVVKLHEANSLGIPTEAYYTQEEVDDNGNFWFLSANDSQKNDELLSDPSVQLLFQGSSYSNFLNIYGKASVSQDKQKIKELWNPELKVWFTEGVDDPRISVIKVEPTEGYYWDNKHGQAIAFIKRLAGAAIGKTIDDSIEGKLKV